MRDRRAAMPAAPALYGDGKSACIAMYPAGVASHCGTNSPLHDTSQRREPGLIEGKPTPFSWRYDH
ncbi:hypothetical protein OH407_23525, partial [Salmonella enterica]|uniref:hypothetical protein n=1 Tax=Salmonella enterica TaxID=28901 RepID=UPI0022B65B38